MLTDVLTVTEISLKVKNLIESNIGNIKIKGEISGLKIASSGHCYFNLKDNINILCCTCWRPVMSKLSFQLEDGMEIIVSGKLTSYGGNSRYQLTVNIISPIGFGLIMQILAARKLKLEEMGIFAKPKKNLPLLPTSIGIVTSITGAVIKDIIHRISERSPLEIIIWPVSVQGTNAAIEITNAIDGFNNLTLRKPDVIIVARGGGSQEDLMCFNEEIVIYSVFNSIIPVISAVGHEVDYTLIDLIADKRAPTPTAAAEFATPVNSILNEHIESKFNLLKTNIKHTIKYNTQKIEQYDNIYKYVENYINTRQQILDDLGFRLINGLPNLLIIKNIRLESIKLNILNLTRIINSKKRELKHQINYIGKSIYNIITKFESMINIKESMLQILDYKNVLKRGFTIITRNNCEYIYSKNTLKKDDKLNIKFFDGDIIVQYFNEDNNENL